MTKILQNDANTIVLHHDNDIYALSRRQLKDLIIDSIDNMEYDNKYEYMLYLYDIKSINDKIQLANIIIDNCYNDFYKSMQLNLFID